MIKFLGIKNILVLSFDYFVMPLLIFVFLFEPNFLHGYIFSFDEGQHLAWINGILEGKVPYRDLYMIYGPLLEYFPAILMKVFGPSLQVLRAFYHFGTILSILIAYFLCRNVLKSRFFTCLAIWLIANLSVIPRWSSRWGGPRLGLGLLALLLFNFYFSSKRKAYIFMTGLITGIAFLTSQEIGICLIIACLISLLGFKFYEKEQLIFCIKKIIIYFFGILIVLLPMFIYLTLKGAFFDYLRIMFFDVPFRLPAVFRDNYPFLSLPQVFALEVWIKYFTSRTFYFYGAIGLYCLSLIYLFGKALKGRFSTQNLSLLLLVGFGLPLLKSATRMLGGPQFNISLPPVLIIACLFLKKLMTMFRSDLEIIFLNKRKLGRNDPCYCGSNKKYKNCCLGKNKTTFINLTKSIILCLIIVFSFIFIFISTQPFISLKRTCDKFNIYKKERMVLTPLRLSRAKGIFVPKSQAKVLTSVIQYLQDKINLEEPIFALPHEGQYYFFLNRPSATRFDSALFAEVCPAYQREVIQDIESKKVSYIIYNKASYLVTDHDPIPNEKRIPEIMDYVREKYGVVKQIDGTFILKRKAS